MVSKWGQKSKETDKVRLPSW